MSVNVTLPEAERKFAEAREEMQVWEAVVSALRKLDAHTRSNGTADDARRLSVSGGSENLNGHPRGRAAVRAVVAERPGIWTLSDVVGEVINRGWATDRKPVEVAVHRLTAAGEARRVQKGVYEFPAPTSEEVEAA